MKRLSLMIAALLMCGCSQLSERVSDGARLLGTGVGVTPDPKIVQTYREQQDQYLLEYAQLAGIKNTPLDSMTSEQWPLIVKAGINQINARCESYKAAINHVNRSRRLINTELTATGAAAAAIMGIAGASAKAIAITATAFGLAVLTSDNLHSTVLYDLDPASVFTIIGNAQGAVLQTYDADKLNNRVEAVQFLQSYIATCLPANIEIHVNEALKSSTAKQTTEAGVTRVRFVNPLLEPPANSPTK